MPSASTSTFRMPSASRSSLSHSIMVRSSIAAFSIGTSSSSRPRVMTKPPTCCDRWRGKPMSSLRECKHVPHARALRIEAGPRHGILVASVRRRHPRSSDDERADRVFRQAQGLADVADRRAAAIGDDGGGNAGALAAIFVVDVLDHLLAPLVLEVDVDVGRLVALRGDEALEQQVSRVRIDLGDAEAVADRRIGRRAAALAEDVLAAREADDVVDGEEIGRVVAAARSARARARLRAHLVRHAPRIASAAPSSVRCVSASCGDCRSRRSARRDIRSWSSSSEKVSASLKRSRLGDRLRRSRNRRAISTGGFRWRSALAASYQPARSIVVFSRMQVSTSASGRRSG